MAVLQLTNLATLKTRLAIKKNSQDGALRQLLRTVSAHLAQKINRADDLDERTRTQLFDVDSEQRRFPLDGTPIASVTSIIYDPQQDFASGSVIDTQSFVIDFKANAVALHYNLLGPYMASRMQSLQIVYESGLTDLAALRASSKFAALEEAAILMIQQISKRRRTTGEKVNMSGQGGSVSMESVSQLPLVKEIWQPMRRSNLGR